MKLPEVNANTRTMTVLAAAVAVLFFGGVLVYTFSSRQLGLASNELHGKQKQVEDSKKIALRLSDAEQTLAAAQSEIAILETSVSKDEYVPTLLQQLETRGRLLGLKVVSVRPQPVAVAEVAPIKRTSEDPQAAPETASKSGESPEKKAKASKPPYQELKIDIELEGTYWNARNFLHELTQFPKIISVKQINMAPIGAVSRRGSPSLQVRLSVTAFVFPPDSQPPAQPSTTVPTGDKAAALDRRSGNEG